MSRDLQMIGLKDDWYQVCPNRAEFCQRCLKGVDKVASCRKKNICAANRQSEERNFVCECGRIFRQQGDLTRHKCMLLHPDIAIYSPG